MNNDKLRELAGILAQIADGKAWEVKISGFEQWKDPNAETDPLACALFHQIRIKPEPREWWMNIYPSGLPVVHLTKEHADENATSGRIECIRVREVI